MHCNIGNNIKLIKRPNNNSLNLLVHLIYQKYFIMIRGTLNENLKDYFTDF